MNQVEMERHGLQFHGSGGEYFRIWMVNTLLTLVTLGLYWPWASVRKRRYFYNQTLLDGQAFDFLGKPWSIFKGFIGIYLLFVLYQISSQMQWLSMAASIALIGVALLPWLVQKSLRFRARTLSWRGMHGQFHGDLKSSYVNYLLWPLLLAPSLGILYPYWIRRTQNYAMQNLGFGDQRILNQNQSKDFYRLFGKILMLLFAFFATSAAFSLILALYYKSGNPLSLMGGWSFLGLGLLSSLLFLGYLLTIMAVRAMYLVGLKRLRWHGTQLGEMRFEANWTVQGFLRIEIPNMLLTFCTLGLYSPVAQIRRMEYFIDRLSLVGPAGALEDFVCTSQQTIEGASGDAGTDLIGLDLGL